MKMKRFVFVLVTLFAVVPMTASMVGCDAFGQKIEDTPRGTYFETQEAFIFATAIALDQKRAGKISQEDWNTKYNPAIQSGNDLLDSMEQAAITGDFEALEFARSLLVSITNTIKEAE